MNETEKLIRQQQNYVNMLKEYETGKRTVLKGMNPIDMKVLRENIEEAEEIIKKYKRKKTITIKYNEVRTFFDWLIKHKRSESPIPPPQKVMLIASKYKWLYNGFAYRGIKLRNMDVYHGRELVLSEAQEKRILKKKKGDKIQYRSKRRESWTTSKRTAISFTVSNQPKSFPTKKILDDYAKKMNVKGIVIKGKIKNGLHINKAIDYIEKEAEYQENLHHFLGQMPMFGTEGEILGQSIGLVEIAAKINC